jgi:HPt (histidine-containing phosphotransfer) domain-containing protein
MQRIDPLPHRFDRDRFLRLIELVGPEMAPTLLAQLVADLGDCNRRLTAGSETADWALLRETSHDLIALGGSCGAMELQDLAQQLNSAAHEQDHGGLERLAPVVASQITALLALIRATPETGPVPW